MLRPKLMIFDLDGVIMDSEPLHREAKVRVMRELGLDAEGLDLNSHVGRPNSELWDEVIAKNSLSLSSAELESRQYDSILEQLVENRTPVSRGLKSLLDLLGRLEISCAVCSSSNRTYVDRVLSHFSLKDTFSVVVAGDEVTAKKPAPDGYLLVLERAGVKSSSAYAVEDSTAGVTAAGDAGIECIGYANPTSGNQNLSGAFMRIDALDEIVPWVAGFYTGCCFH